MRIFGFVIEISRQNQTELTGDRSLEKLHPASWKATHRHTKGGKYRRLFEGLLESDRSAVVVYDDREGQIWVRSSKEFHDGHFLPLESK